MKDPFPPLLLNWRRHSTFPDGPMTSAVTSLGSTSPERYSSLKGTCVEKYVLAFKMLYLQDTYFKYLRTFENDTVVSSFKYVS